MDKKVKVIAMYLPQFHKVKENDEWWGEGFTEWTSVKDAKPLFEGHIQPVRPDNDNYYDLLQKDTMIWQSDLMHMYGIDGLCMYHYWFKNGKKILEKPAENLLGWQDINISFCFCWANESWVRSWSNINEGNVWDRNHEVYDDNSSGILLEQGYGNEIDWKNHFMYLLKFFTDKRYIKVNNKPVFVIYRPELIKCLEEMISLWNKMAIDTGFDGIFLIAANCDKRCSEIVDMELIHEPQATFLREYQNIDNIKEKRKIIAYDDVWDRILKYQKYQGKISYGGFVGYDDSPRRGDRGMVVRGKTPEKFKQYITELYAKNVVNNSPFMFINAWNEWGEGMYLEPDTMHKENFLKSFKFARCNYINYLSKYEKQKNEKGKYPSENKQYELMQEKNRRYECYWKILHKWLLLKEANKSLSVYLEKNGYYKIAIYGMGMLGKHLIKELEQSNIQICYGIDQYANSMKSNIPVVSVDGIAEPVDAIVVTVTYDFQNIKKMLEKKYNYRVISLEYVIEES